ncbi:ABC transporter permease [Oenococcus alcoholitolerans]|uniref:ABC transporter permease n=1 Tax=Oenococcus alcoholitolerans TaxID=931074 RepID=UPI003F6E8BB7
MWKLIIRRFLMMIPQLLLMTVLLFALAKMMPGDPFTGRFGAHTDMATLIRLRREAGLDDPWPVQYFHWLGNIFHGNFGDSYVMQKSVASLIAQRLGNTVWLGILTLILTYAIGIPTAVASATHEGSFRDRFWTTYNSITGGIPSFVMYLFMLFIFGFTLNWFPTTGSVDVNSNGFLNVLFSRLYHMILPAVSVALFTTVYLFNTLRTSLLDARSSDFVRTAQAKGVPTKQVFWKHIFRNSMLPVASNFGFDVVAVFSGAVILETIFNYPGMGQLFVQSIQTRDYTTINAIMLFSGFLTLIGSMLNDIFVSWVDPRVRIK